jgi:hypothetical protein
MRNEPGISQANARRSPAGDHLAMNSHRRIILLFVTYSVATSPQANTAMMGVLKRCLRLIEHLPPRSIEPLLLHFGQMPDGDPLIRKVLGRLSHPPFDAQFFSERGPLRIRSIRPDVVVLGEGPGSGMMLAASRWALERNIPQICIENYYGAKHILRFFHDNPWIKRWLLLGLPDSHPFGKLNDRAVLAPPLFAPAAKNSGPAHDLTVLAYDPHLLPRVAGLLARLPENVRIRIVQPQESRSARRLWGRRENKVLFSSLPRERIYRQYLSGTSVVVCKNGYQQMMEALAVGTPVIAVDSPGGVPEAWLSPHVRRFIRFVPRESGDWDRVIAAAGLWLGCRPTMPWKQAVQSFDHPARHASQLLLGLINEVV